MGQTEKQKLWKKNHYEQNKDSYRLKQQDRRKEIKEYIDGFKTKCTVCGETDIACLDFHHIDKDEKGDDLPNAIKNKWSNNRISKEMEKCVVLCSNCHRKLHYYDLSIEGLIEYCD